MLAVTGRTSYLVPRIECFVLILNILRKNSVFFMKLGLCVRICPIQLAAPYTNGFPDVRTFTVILPTSPIKFLLNAENQRIC